MEPQTKKPLITFIVLIVVVLAAVFGLYIYFNGFPNLSTIFRRSDSIDKPANNPSSSTTPSPTLAQEKQVLQNQVTFIIPSPKSSSPFSQANLDKEVLSLLPSDITIDSVSSTSYTDNSTGYTISYTLNKNISDSFNGYLTPDINLPVRVLSGSQTSLAARIVAESAIYRAEISLESIDDSHTKASIQIQKKIH